MGAVWLAVRGSGRGTPTPWGSSDAPERKWGPPPQRKKPMCPAGRPAWQRGVHHLQNLPCPAEN
eukprot:15133287-Heterocapsa_arctica.AAC.1